MDAQDGRRSVVVVGSGPAGYAAGVYAARGGLNPLLLEGSVGAGGALMTTTDVENYPGFTEGITGPELMAGMREQAARFGAELVADEAQKVELHGDTKIVRSASGREYTAEAVILATGSRYRNLCVPGEAEFAGHGVSWCATCDGFFFKGLDIAVVGGGDSALEEALFLTRFAASVTVVHRRGALRASKIMQDRARANAKIGFRWHAEVCSVAGDRAVTGMRLRDVRTGEVDEVAVRGVFVAIGHEPRSELFRGLVDLDPDGYVVVAHPSTRTSVTGVFACGDLVDRHYRQAITAAGTGCAAALDAERYLMARVQSGSLA
ncbi:MAG TPA: thioredoxin-disulfide reductase [Streptosporangiaceae bacterium]|jgi:thioredoxin reductase (NADPH)|nr:thioredoxin-disulfide reductase [Streptosporangiaceae bacterium]